MNNAHIYRFLCIVVHPKRFTIMWGGGVSPQPPPNGTSVCIFFFYEGKHDQKSVFFHVVGFVGVKA